MALEPEKTYSSLAPQKGSLEIPSSLPSGEEPVVTPRSGQDLQKAVKKYGWEKIEKTPTTSNKNMHETQKPWSELISLHRKHL